MATEEYNKRRVWNHFDGYRDEVIVEPERTKNKKIQALLKPASTKVQGVLTQTPGASKTGAGLGRPDFIIQFKTKAGGLRDDLIIIVECKASDHKSAVSQVHHYSAYLSKEYDVLSIATSGEEEHEFEVSHFLQLKGQTAAKGVFADKLLPPEDYLEEYLTESAAQYREDYDSLLTFSGEFSETLHSHKILAPQRALLLGCILIALEDPSFANSQKDANDPDHGYKQKADGQALATSLVGTAMDQLRQGLSAPQHMAKLKVLEDHFAFIRSNLALTTERDAGTGKPVLEGIIESVHTKVHGFNKNHEYIDTLGQLYIEFLRYANADSSLGIVLTPPHIAKFMAEVAGVSKGSFVYDSCTGTAGFLISAMGLMVQDAAGEKTKIADIKQKQLIGIEYQAHMLALAASNMFIHEDGKTNIIQGDCFDEEKQRLVKWRTQGNEGEPPGDWAKTVEEDEEHALGADVGLLNPPYKVQKSDREELEFIEANLACLKKGGQCVAIVPMSQALAQKGEILKLKKRLLKHHTLEAVFSMPDELFFNSGVGVVTCVMVFTAWKPHLLDNEGKKPKKSTYFGYYKDDGFVKRKNKGRTDFALVFEHAAQLDKPSIRQLWIGNYESRDDVTGLSVKEKVTADMEWCAEAYMETDYEEKLTQGDFEEVLKNYALYCLGTDAAATSPPDDELEE